MAEEEAALCPEDSSCSGEALLSPGWVRVLGALLFPDERGSQGEPLSADEGNSRVESHSPAEEHFPFPLCSGNEAPLFPDEAHSRGEEHFPSLLQRVDEALRNVVLELHARFRAEAGCSPVCSRAGKQWRRVALELCDSLERDSLERDSPEHDSPEHDSPELCTVLQPGGQLRPRGR